jgi:hypothetical protein
VGPESGGAGSWDLAMHFCSLKTEGPVGAISTFFFFRSEARTRTRTNTNPYDTKNIAVGRSG